MRALTEAEIANFGVTALEEQLEHEEARLQRSTKARAEIEEMLTERTREIAESERIIASLKDSIYRLRRRAAQ